MTRKIYISTAVILIILVIICAAEKPEREIRLKQRGNQIYFYYQGKGIVSAGKAAHYYLLEEKGKQPVRISLSRRIIGIPGFLHPAKINVAGKLGTWGKFKERLSIESFRGEPIVKSQVKICIKRECEFILLRPFALHNKTQPFFLSPGFIYNSNNRVKSTGKFPQLHYRGAIDVPESSVFFYRTNRSSHCAVMAIFDKHIFALCTEEGLRIGHEQSFYYHGLGIDTSKENGDTLYLTVGYKNYPARYNGNCNLKLANRWEDKPDYGYIKARPGDKLTVTSYIYMNEAADLFAYEKADELFYYLIHDEPMKRATRQEAIKKISKAIVEDAYCPECGLFKVIDGSTECNIGWTGGVMIAYPLLQAGRYLNNQPYQDMARRAIDILCQEGFNPNANMFYDCNKAGKWTTRGWWTHWGGNAHLAYTNGQACYYILKAYMILADQQRQEKRFWLEAVKKIVDQAIKHQGADGAFSLTFSLTNGAPSSLEGFAGCWFLPTSAKLYQITREPRYLEAARKAEDFYFTWLASLEIWGTPTDAENAVDQEGNLAFAIGTRLLHQLTGEPEYLSHLEHSLHYDFSWKWSYNSYVANEPLRSLGWKSVGGNGTSSCNQHLHQMGNLICGEMYYAYQQTGNQYYRDRLRDSMLFGLGTFNRSDGEFGFGKEGWATEQFFHTDAFQGELPRDGGIWHRYLPWAAASVLNSLLEPIPEELYYR